MKHCGYEARDDLWYNVTMRYENYPKALSVLYNMPILCVHMPCRIVALI